MPQASVQVLTKDQAKLNVVALMRRLRAFAPRRARRHHHGNYSVLIAGASIDSGRGGASIATNTSATLAHTLLATRASSLAAGLGLKKNRQGRLHCCCRLEINSYQIHCAQNSLRHHRSFAAHSGFARTSIRRQLTSRPMTTREIVRMQVLSSHFYRNYQAQM